MLMSMSSPVRDQVGPPGAALRPPPIRVVFVLSKFSVGGAEKQLANLITHRPTNRSEVEVHAFTFLPPTSREVQRRFEDAGARCTLIDRSATSFPVFFLRLVTTMLRVRPHLVSTILDSSVGAWGRLAAWIARVPVIVHSDRLLATEGTRAHYLLRPYLDRATTRFLPNAQAIADRLVCNGVPAAKIRVMPNGVDLDAFSVATVSSMRSRLGVDRDDTVLGFVGRLVPQKRVDLLLTALLRVPVADRPSRVVLAGGGPQEASLRSQVTEDPWLSQHCTFLGVLDDVADLLAGIDYLVLPSDSEGLPNVVLEAMAMAKPVISTRVSDVADVLGDTGVTVPVGDAEALADAIRGFERMTREDRSALGARARQRVERVYDIRIRARDFWDAHLECVHERLPHLAVPGSGGAP